MKDYLVVSLEFDVLIKGIPNNVPKSQIVEIARRIYCEHIRPVTMLNNISLYKNKEINKFAAKYLGMDCIPNDFCMCIDYSEYKKSS